MDRHLVWLGADPVLEQRITGLRLIWPDDPAHKLANTNAVDDDNDVEWSDRTGTEPTPARIFGNTARRYAHLAVIDGGRS